MKLLFSFGEDLPEDTECMEEDEDSVKIVQGPKRRIRRGRVDKDVGDGEGKGVGGGDDVIVEMLGGIASAIKSQVESQARQAADKVALMKERTEQLKLRLELAKLGVQTQIEDDEL
jgi:hypothetical protein